MRRKNFARKIDLGIGGISIPLPCFFPSISSIKTNLSILEYLQVLTALKHPLFLVSAYDLYHCQKRDIKKVHELLKKSIAAQKIVLMDSGNYESYWKKDKNWTENKYREILRNIPHHVAFSFDSLVVSNHGTRNIIRFAEKQVLDGQRYSSGTVAPIIHSPRTEELPEIISMVVDKLNPFIIAIAERRLGEGIVARAETVYKIRKILNKKKIYYPLHLLGTGNPLSILIYSMCGADSFDGLEWCQTTVDHKTAILHHFQQREFFGKQSIFCGVKGLPYTQATLAHNIQFYTEWMLKVQQGLVDGNISKLANKYIPKPALLLLKQRLPEIF